MGWRKELKKNVCTIDELKEYVELSHIEEKKLRHIVEIQPMSLPRYYLSLIDWNDPNDPIRKMSVPSLNELNLAGSYDTSGERENTKLPGLQHKYSQTALILANNRCSMYCRHCFRKRLAGIPSEEILQKFKDAIKYIKSHPEINNVLITGGDPLMLSNRVLQKFFKYLSAVPHIDFIRIGSRLPVTFPQRILEDDELMELFRMYSTHRRRIYIVTQFNHPREITDESSMAIDRLLKAGVLINNQTVLLKGVNDDPEILANLLNQLVAIGDNPYYVFQCRPVKRVKRQFAVPLVRGLDIIENARKHLNGPSKRFKYVMSHRTGKIEIIGIMNDEIYFKYHQAKNPRKLGKFFKKNLNDTATWLDEL